MKAIMISIKPEWVAKILNGEKTIEIRKTMPKCDLPIDVYIYCTKEKPRAILTDKGCVLANKLPVGGNSQYKSGYSLSGQVVAKFTLNKVEEISCEKFNIETKSLCEKDLLKLSCLALEELRDYGDFVYSDNCASISSLYAWHISNLVIFDKPRELSEFKTHKTYNLKDLHNCHLSLNKAPQSWCYVEV